MDVNGFISMIKNTATVRDLGDDRFLISYLGNEAIVSVKVAKHEQGSNEQFFGDARKCPYCGQSCKVKPNGLFIIHGPKKSRCPGSNQKYEATNETH